MVESNYNKNLVIALESIIPDCLFVIAGGNGVEPQPPYCLVTLISEVAEGRPQKTTKSRIDGNNQAWQTIQQDYSLNFSLTFHGKLKSDSEKMCRYLNISLESDFSQDIFYQNGMGVLGYKTFPRLLTTTDNIIQYVNDTIDLELLVNRSEEFPIQIIDSVEILGEVTNDDDYDIEVKV